MSTNQQHILEADDSTAAGVAPGNRAMQVLLIAAIAASGMSMLFSIGTAVASASDQPAASVASGEE